MFIEKIKAWRLNEIKKIDHDFQKMSFRAIENDNKTKDAFIKLLKSIKVNK